MDGIRKTRTTTEMLAPRQAVSSEANARPDFDIKMPAGGMYDALAQEASREPSGRLIRRGRPLPRKTFRVVLIGFVTIGVIGVALFVRYRPEPASQQSTEPVGEETARMVARVGEHAALPDGEEPIIAMIKDSTPLRGQAFYSRARVGDAVLFYPKARIAILYDPRLDRIINMAPLAEGDAAFPAAATTTGGVSPR